jgi:hypothetical protein
MPNLILLGDFNAHHPLRGYSRIDESSTLLSNLLEETNLVTMNCKLPTVFTYTGESGVLDLSILSPVLKLDYLHRVTTIALNNCILYSARSCSHYSSGSSAELARPRNYRAGARLDMCVRKPGSSAGLVRASPRKFYKV